MEMKLFELPPFMTNAYLLSNLEKREAVLFDAPSNAHQSVHTELLESGCKLTAIYLTHGHWDHMDDVAAFADEGVPIYGHPMDLDIIEDPVGLQGPWLQMMGLPVDQFRSGKLDHYLEDGQVITILDLKVSIAHVPGHSPGSIQFYFEDARMAISGDTLFAGSIGRTDLPEGDFDVLAKSIREKIYTLPDDTILLPGHGPRTTVGREKVSNPFVKL